MLVDRKQCNQERIVELWARHRRTVRQQAELDFMSEVLAEAPLQPAATEKKRKTGGRR